MQSPPQPPIGEVVGGKYKIALVLNKMLLPGLVEPAAQLRHRNTARVVDVDVTAAGIGAAIVNDPPPNRRRRQLRAQSNRHAASLMSSG